MPKVTEAHFVARREQILGAAFRCLARKGYSRLTVREIAAEAGISVGTLYLHFENKQEILKAISEQGRDLTAGGIEEVAAEGGPLKALVALFELVLGRLDDPESAAELRVDVELWAEAIHHPAVRKIFHHSHRHWLGRLAELVSAAQEAGELPAGVDPEDLARLLTATLAGLELMKVMQPDAPLAPLVEPFRALLRLDPDAKPEGG